MCTRNAGRPADEGLSLTKCLRQAHPGAGVIITTALTRIGDDVSDYRNGTDPYITQSLHAEALVAGLPRATRKSPSTAPQRVPPRAGRCPSVEPTGSDQVA
jgi:DNA-binding response OmpR family regulator